MSLGADLDDPNDYVFRARLLNPHTLLHVLQAIDLHDTAAVFINNCGIRFTVDKESGFQISSFLERSLFDLFDIVDDSRTITFRVGIRHLINSLNPLIDTFDRSSNASNDPDNPESNKSSIQMLYRGIGFPLVVLLDLDGNTISVCREMTQESVGLSLLELPKECGVAQCYVLSDLLRDVFADLDMASERLQITFDYQHGLKFCTRSQYAIIEAKIHVSSSALSHFTCDTVHTFVYPITVLKHSLKVLGQSKKTCIRVNGEGLLSLQYQIVLDRRIQVFVEYVCIPSIDVL